MNAAVGCGLVLAYLICSVGAYRRGYVIGYEGHNDYWRGRENQYNRHRHRHHAGLGAGLLWALGGPASLLVLWVGRRFTPTPPTRAAELHRQEVAAQEANARRIDQIEAEWQAERARIAKETDRRISEIERELASAAERPPP